MNEQLGHTARTIEATVSEWAARAAIELDTDRLYTLATDEAELWLADGFTADDYSTGWNCWNEEHTCTHTDKQRDFESMVAESVVKLAKRAAIAGE